MDHDIAINKYASCQVTAGASPSHSAECGVVKSSESASSRRLRRKLRLLRFPSAGWFISKVSGVKHDGLGNPWNSCINYHKCAFEWHNP